MKTTVELPADLLRRLKAMAALEGRSMKDVIREALEAAVRRKTRAEPGWLSVFGSVPRSATREVDRRIAEGRRVDPRDWE